MTRRTFLVAGAAATTLAAAPRAFAPWQPSQRYPDPAIQVVDPSFARYRLAATKVERLATGFRCSRYVNTQGAAGG
jgi:gluconolactonase